MENAPTILAVDFDSESLALLSGILGPAGYIVLPGGSGEQWLAAASTRLPDLILLDVDGERGGAIESCRRRWAGGGTETIPIMIVGVFTDAMEWVAGLRAGAVDYVRKPFQREELLARIGTHLALNRARAESARARRALGSAVNDHRLAEEKLRQSHALLENLARLVPSVIYQYRLYPDGRTAFPYSSPGMNTIYEVAPEEVRDDATPVLGRLHPEDRERVGNLILESARTLEEFYCEFRVVLPRQGLRWRWSQGHPERTEDGGTLWHGIISDITDRKVAEEERARLEAQLQQALRMESIGRLAGGIAHDFNNLLSVVLSYASFARERVPPGDPLRRDLLEIEKAGGLAAVLTRQLLAFSRKQMMQPLPLDLNLVLADMKVMLHRFIGEHIEIEQQLEPDLGPVVADPGQLEQVILNLVINARDAMPGGGKLTIQTSNVEVEPAPVAQPAGVEPGSYVMLAITDAGIGMDEPTRLKVFEPFFTTKGKGKGTGLGLSTVYGIVKQSGGHVSVVSAPNRGSTFRVYLPRDAAAPRPRAAMAVPVPSRAGGSESILVAEDEEALREVAGRVLTAAGYTVMTAASGEAALAVNEQHKGGIDLLLTDVVMPGLLGTELAARLLEVRPALKVVYMSGYADDAIVRGGVLAPELHFLAKPFTSVELARKVREVLDGHDSSRHGDAVASAGSEIEPREVVIDRSALRALPEAVLDRLRKAVTAARYDELVALVESIRNTQPDVAEALAALANRFDYEAIRKLLS